MPAFTRRKIRLPIDDYVGKRIYFVTICCHNRRPILRETNLLNGMLATLRALSSRHEFAIHAYCFMPDHLHILCEGLSNESRLLDLVGRFKQQTAFEHSKEFGVSLWQTRSYDHVLRRADAMEDVACYIWMNPVRKGLCADPREFPFAGSFTLPWKTIGPSACRWVSPWRRDEDAGLKPGATQT